MGGDEHMCRHWPAQALGCIGTIMLSGALPLLLGGARPFLLSALLRLVLLVQEVDDDGGASPDWHAWNGTTVWPVCHHLAFYAH